MPVDWTKFGLPSAGGAPSGGASPFGGAMSAFGQMASNAAAAFPKPGGFSAPSWGAQPGGIMGGAGQGFQMPQMPKLPWGTGGAAQHTGFQAPWMAQNDHPAAAAPAAPKMPNLAAWGAQQPGGIMGGAGQGGQLQMPGGFAASIPWAAPRQPQQAAPQAAGSGGGAGGSTPQTASEPARNTGPYKVQSAPASGGQPSFQYTQYDNAGNGDQQIAGLSPNGTILRTVTTGDGRVVTYDSGQRPISQPSPQQAQQPARRPAPPAAPPIVVRPPPPPAPRAPTDEEVARNQGAWLV